MASGKANREDKATKARPTGRQIKPAMSNHPLLQFATQSQLKANRGADTFKVGDGVRVSTKVREGDKERTQVFSGIVISRKGGNVQETFTVRRVSFGEGVERTFPVHSPNIEKIEVERVSQVMKARLYYLRGRQGKSATKVKEKRYDPSAETVAK
jgi:large subunit ribosomal protein L19